MVEFDPRRSAMIDRACEAVARMGAPAVPALQRLVAQGRIEGAFAAATLGVIGPPAAAAAPDLVAALGSENSLLRGGARNAVIKLGPGAVPALLAALAAGDVDRRAGAAERLGVLAADPQRSVPALTAALRDADAEVQGAAAHALGAFGAAARPAVASMLAVESVGAVADYDFGEALAQIVADASSLRTALHSTNAATSRRAALALGRMPPPAGGLLIEALSSSAPSVRAAALAGLVPASAGAAAAVPVSRLLHDESPEVRRDALVFLSNLGRSAGAARAAVAAALGDTDAGVRATAVEALAQIASSPTEIAPAVPLLRDAEPKVRQAAVGALASRPAGPSTLPALLDLLQDPEMAPFAAQAVGALRLEEGVEPLTRLLRSTDPVTRRAGARALARLGPLAAPAAEPLMRALQQETGEASRCDYWNALAGIGPAAATQMAQARRLLGETRAASCDEARAALPAPH